MVLENRAEAAELSGSDDGLKLRGDARQGGGHIPKNELGIEPQDAIAEAAELFISAGIGGAAAGMTTTIDFDYQAEFRSYEIRYEPKDRHLATEGDAELFSGKAAPKKLL